MTPECIEGSNEELRYETASITSRYLACVLNAVCQRRTTLPCPELRFLRCAPVAVRAWRYSVAGALRFTMDGRLAMLARSSAGGEDTRGPQRCTIAKLQLCADKLTHMLENPVDQNATTRMLDVWRR